MKENNMGWANCGTDRNGRPIGYAFEAICDHPGCEEKIDRGLPYVCGDMHGEDEISCEKYFCEKHRQNWVETGDGNDAQICDECAKELLKSKEYSEDMDTGTLRRVT